MGYFIRHFKKTLRVLVPVGWGLHLQAIAPPSCVKLKRYIIFVTIRERFRTNIFHTSSKPAMSGPDTVPLQAVSWEAINIALGQHICTYIITVIVFVTMRT